VSLLRHAAFAGGDWVIWILLALSVTALAVVLERIAVFRREGVLGAGQTRAGAAAAEPGAAGTPPPFFARRKNPVSAAATAADRIRDRLVLERRLVVLGSLGTLSPFVGLLGTVLGIIRAFRDLAQVGSGHPEIVMQGIAEALIATAAGLCVAIMSVAAFNYFNRRIKEAFAEAERLEHLHGVYDRRGR